MKDYHLIPKCSALESFTKKELIDELSKREGVKEIVVSAYKHYSMFFEEHECLMDTGAARILVVKE